VTTAPQSSGVSCPACHEAVPAGVYCGACGSDLRHTTHGHGISFRSRVYAAAPGERVLRLSIVSSLFPHLSGRSRPAFRIAVVVVLVALVALAALRWQAPLVATSAVSLPLLFLLYLQEGQAYEGLPIVPLLGTSVLGVGFGYGWATLTAGHLSRAIAEAALIGLSTHTVLVYGLLLPLITAVLTVAPGVLMRPLRPSDSEALDGFLIGAIGAVGFACAWTLTRLAPQLRTGVIAHGRPLLSLVYEALIQGVAIPLTAAGVGGVVGAAVWLKRRDRIHRGRWLSSPITALTATLVLYAALGLVDVGQPADLVLVVLHLVGAAAALLSLRFGMQSALLHEKHDFQIGPPAVCAHCEQVVAQMPFCPLCGVAGHVSSRRSRRELRMPLPPDSPTSPAPAREEVQ
jgi:hypothetical protein